MKIVQKKLKEKKMSDMNRVQEYADKYSNAYFIGHADIPNKSIQKLRADIDGKILFIKKTMFAKVYPSIQIPSAFFLIFSNEDLTDTLRDFSFPAFLKEGDVPPERVVLEAGEIHNLQLADLLEGTITKGAKVFLEEERVICDPGTGPINATQAKILHLLGKKMKLEKLSILDVKSSSELKQNK